MLPVTVRPFSVGIPAKTTDESRWSFTILDRTSLSESATPRMELVPGPISERFDSDDLLHRHANQHGLNVGLSLVGGRYEYLSTAFGAALSESELANGETCLRVR